jgi:hypothetical protein
MINFYVTLCLVLIYINSFLDMEITFEFLKTMHMRISALSVWDQNSHEAQEFPYSFYVKKYCLFF